MTTKREYYCNLCRKKTDDGSGGCMHGIRFVSGGILLEIPIQAENHICGECLRALVAAYEEQKVSK